MHNYCSLYLDISVFVFFFKQKTAYEIKTQNKEDNEFKLVPLGMGRNDFKEILEAAERADAHTVIVEQDTSVDRPPLEAAEISRKYLKDTFGI